MAHAAAGSDEPSHARWGAPPYPGSDESSYSAEVGCHEPLVASSRSRAVRPDADDDPVAAGARALRRLACRRRVVGRGIARRRSCRVRVAAPWDADARPLDEHPGAAAARDPDALWKTARSAAGSVAAGRRTGAAAIECRGVEQAPCILAGGRRTASGVAAVGLNRRGVDARP